MLGTPQAHAGSLLTSISQGTCTTTNCSSIRFGGTYQYDQFNQSDPFVTQVFVASGECVRIDIISEEQDLEARLIAPNGTIYFNDDRNGASDRRPLIKAETASGNPGWWVLMISKYDGLGTGSNFVASYGRYVSGNPNCATPTPPTATLSAARK